MSNPLQDSLLWLLLRIEKKGIKIHFFLSEFKNDAVCTTPFRNRCNDRPQEQNKKIYAKNYVGVAIACTFSVDVKETVPIFSGT